MMLESCTHPLWMHTYPNTTSVNELTVPGSIPTPARVAFTNLALPEQCFEEILLSVLAAKRPPFRFSLTYPQWSGLTQKLFLKKGKVVGTDQELSIEEILRCVCANAGRPADVRLKGFCLPGVIPREAMTYFFKHLGVSWMNMAQMPNHPIDGPVSLHIALPQSQEACLQDVEKQLPGGLSFSLAIEQLVVNVSITAKYAVFSDSPIEILLEERHEGLQNSQEVDGFLKSWYLHVAGRDIQTGIINFFCQRRVIPYKVNWVENLLFQLDECRSNHCAQTAGLVTLRFSQLLSASSEASQYETTEIIMSNFTEQLPATSAVNEFRLRWHLTLCLHSIVDEQVLPLSIPRFWKDVNTKLPISELTPQSHFFALLADLLVKRGDFFTEIYPIMQILAYLCTQTKSKTPSPDLPQIFYTQDEKTAYYTFLFGLTHKKESLQIPANLEGVRNFMPQNLPEAAALIRPFKSDLLNSLSTQPLIPIEDFTLRIQLEKTCALFLKAAEPEIQWLGIGLFNFYGEYFSPNFAHQSLFRALIALLHAEANDGLTEQLLERLKKICPLLSAEFKQLKELLLQKTSPEKCIKGIIAQLYLAKTNHKFSLAEALAKDSEKALISYKLQQMRISSLKAGHVEFDQVIHIAFELIKKRQLSPQDHLIIGVNLIKRCRTLIQANPSLYSVNLERLAQLFILFDLNTLAIPFKKAVKSAEALVWLTDELAKHNLHWHVKMLEKTVDRHKILSGELTMVRKLIAGQDLAHAKEVLVRLIKFALARAGTSTNQEMSVECEKVLKVCNKYILHDGMFLAEPAYQSLLDYMSAFKKC